MQTKLLSGMATLLSLTTMAACSQTVVPTAAPQPTVINKERAKVDQTVPGSYIVKASGDGTASIRRVFAQYGVELVSPLGNEQYEVRLQRDPGLDALMGLAVNSGGAIKTIQPNFVYHAD